MEMIRDGQSETQLTHVLLHHWWAAVDQTLGITHNQTFTRAQLAELLDGLGLQEVQIHEINETEPDPLDGRPRRVHQLQRRHRALPGRRRQHRVVAGRAPGDREAAMDAKKKLEEAGAVIEVK